MAGRIVVAEGNISDRRSRTVLGTGRIPEVASAGALPGESLEMRPFLIFALVLNLLSVACGPEIRHVFQDREAIEAHLKGELPVGMDKETVRDRLAKMGATITQDRDISFRSRSNESRCSSHFRVLLSTYRLPFDVDVVAFIGFDTTDRVCDIEVRKWTDAL